MTHTPVAPRGTGRQRREPGEVFGGGFSLFADMLLVGLLTSVACLPVVTAPAAFSAASATLRGTARSGVQISVRGYVGELRARLGARTLLAGLVPPLFALLLFLDSRLLGADLPGAQVLAPALLLLALGAAVVGLRATALEEPHRLSARESLVRSVADPRGSLLLAGAVVLAALLAWAMPMLVPLLPGPLAFAATAVDLRSPTVRTAP
ncbi:hypothetical protein OG785_40895 [Streptomyces sp. NBC_00006]|uniref:hypothetical protein n=1 Tax=unclassified Streptomyces TaxID=2593676 RepID=UPI00225BB0D7|nr:MULTISPECIES: hypothetical protein [unclassified Streptomyces]MCX4835892.1 hypothetical protein [Streptomyces sp. NBC_01016]MCX5536907.1 hypothetical protein [Streptomyces sp. NBC_00006]